jgi:hypothetical protein
VTAGSNLRPRLRAVVARSAFLAVLAAALALPPGAGAAARRVPPGWMGVMVDGPMLDRDLDTEPEFDRMVTDGVESIRTAFYWADAQPHRSWDDVPAAQRGRFRDVDGVPTDFAESDRVLAAATRRALGVLPVIIRSPGWAARNPSSVASSPADPGAYARFAAALVRRYGPSGTFWAEHPELSPMPIRAWQVWNEPNITRYWAEQPFPRPYVRLLRAARAAIVSADPGARIVLCGLANFSWLALDSLYAAGARGLFDYAAVHPFTRRATGALRILRHNRRVMARRGDARRPLMVTELTWSSAKGRTRNPFGWETTEPGQAERLRQAYRLLVAARRRLRIERVYWYTWLTPDGGSPNSFDWSGLRKLQGGRAVDKPALRAFRRVARRLEGCAKAAVATRCR